MQLSKSQYSKIQSVIGQRRREAILEADRKKEQAYKEAPLAEEAQRRILSLMPKLYDAHIANDEKKARSIEEKISVYRDEKNEILKKAGYEEKSFEPQFYCAQCGDLGYVAAKDGKKEKCRCFLELETKLLNEISGIMFPADCGNLDDYDTAIFNDSEKISALSRFSYDSVRMYMKEYVLVKAGEFLTEFEQGKAPNFLFMGGAGTGKTFLAASIAKSFMERQYGVMYMSAQGLFELFYNSAPEEEDNSREDVKKSVFGFDLLVVDDLGTENITRFSVSKLFEIISERFSKGRSTIISTNLLPAQINSVYGERIASRLMGEYCVIPFYGEDLRMSKKNREDKGRS